MTAAPSSHRFRFILATGALFGALVTTPAGAQIGACRGWLVTLTKTFPVNSYFEDASGTSPTDVWAVGIAGTGSVIGHWDGKSWQSAASTFPNTDLYDVVAISPNDAWAVGNSYDPHTGNEPARILHWDGTSWRVFPAPAAGHFSRLYSVSADSATDVWAVGFWSNKGAHPLTVHFDGSTWTRVANQSPTGGDEFYGVQVLAPDDVWAGGFQQPRSLSWQPLIEHWNGTAWAVVPAPPLDGDTNFIWDVSGSAPDDVWAAGPLGFTGTPPLTLHWDGTVWSVVPAAYGPDQSFSLVAIKAIAPDDVWAVGQWGTLDFVPGGPAAEHWNGNAWTITRVRSPGGFGSFRGIEATSSTDVWAVGNFYDSLSDGHPMAQLHSPC
jgi:hypothetical protein